MDEELKRAQQWARTRSAHAASAKARQEILERLFCVIKPIPARCQTNEAPDWNIPVIDAPRTWPDIEPLISQLTGVKHRNPSR